MTFRMPDGASLTGATLRVRNLERMRAFWCTVLDLEEVAREGSTVHLAPVGRAFTLTLLHDPDAPLRAQPSIGLYHIALLLPHRAALAATARRLLAGDTLFEGASDHGVSEALYFRDPEGNGLELYRDKPRSQWPRPTRGEGVAMVTRPLDLEDLLQEARQETPLPPETRFGHLHLHVPDLDEAEAFFAGVLGLKVTQRSYPGARFFAAGDYHHHIGTNIWARGRRAPAGATGLVSYTWQAPPGTLPRLRDHVRGLGRVFQKRNGGVEMADPTGCIVRVTEGEGS